MVNQITTQSELFQLLLARMRESGNEAMYPAAYVAYVEDFIAALPTLTVDGERLFPKQLVARCSHCDGGQAVSVLAFLASAHPEAAAEPCNRYFAALTLDLLATLPLGLTLAEVNAAIIAVLDLDPDRLVRVSDAEGGAGWETTAAGERELGVRISVI